MTIEPKGYVRGVDGYWSARTSKAEFLISSIKISETDTSYYHVHIIFNSIGASTNESIYVNDGYNIRCIKDK